MPGGTGRPLLEGPYRAMVEDLLTWRIDPYIRGLESKKAKGRILPFVRGLKFSAQLIYKIRGFLFGTNLTASWGHLLDEEENLCSCECDIIIHKEGHIAKWNGNDEPIMDFKFVGQEKALAVISCKSYLRTSDVDIEYCEEMKPFVNKIWLFAECCGPRSVKNINERAMNLGYEKFWYLYTWSKQGSPQPKSNVWFQFVEEVKKLAE